MYIYNIYIYIICINYMLYVICINYILYVLLYVFVTKRPTFLK